MRKNVPKHLQRFYMPQVEQAGGTTLPSAAGHLIRMHGDAIEGMLWAFPLSPSCLATVHSFTVKRPMLMTECPGTYACICCSDPECVDGAPIARPAHLRQTDNLFSFAQDNSEIRFMLKPGASYTSRSICLTQDFPHENPALWSLGFAQLAQALSLIEPNMHTPMLRPLMHLIQCDAARGADTARIAHAGAVRSLSMVMESATSALTAHAAQGSRPQRLLAERTKRLIATNLDEPFSLSQLADMLLVGRSTLCAAFKGETGQTIGEFTQETRMKAACDMLANSQLSTAEVARRVGYVRQGSFTEAFKAHVGETPSAWRRGL